MTFTRMMTRNHFNTLPTTDDASAGARQAGAESGNSTAGFWIKTKWLRCLRIGTLSVVLLGLLWLSCRADAESNGPVVAGSIGGRVTNERGEPILARVFLYRYPFDLADPTALAPNADAALWTDAAGVYTFTGLTVGVYRVGFSDLNDRINQVIAYSSDLELPAPVYAYQFYSDSIHFAADARDLTVMGNAITDIDAVLHPVSVVTGTINLTTTMAARVDVLVLLLQPTQQGWQFVRGDLVENVTLLLNQPHRIEFRVGRLAAGAYRLCAMAFAGWGASDPLFQDWGWVGCYGGSGAAPLDPLTDLPVQAASDITASAGITLPNLNFTLTHLAVRPLPDVPGISGRVTSDDGQPLTGILVQAYRSDYSPEFVPVEDWVKSVYTYTNANGEYRLSISEPGYYALGFDNGSVHYWPGQYIPEFYADAATLAQATALQWAAGQKLSQIDASLSRMPLITGRLHLTQVEHIAAPLLVAYQQSTAGWTAVHQLDLTRVGSVSFPERFNARTGDYVLQLTPGTYRIAVHAMLGFSLAPQPIYAYYGGATLETASDLLLEPNQLRADVNITLGEGDFEGVIDGQVTGDGMPLAGIQVELYHTGSAQPALFVTTDSNGHYRMSALLNGVYWVRALPTSETYVPTFYGGYTVFAGAKAITVVGPSPVTAVNIDLATQPSHQIFLPTVRR